MHWPFRLRKGANFMALEEDDWLPLDLVGCWKELEKGVELGLAKAIGVSNFSTMRLKEIEPHARIVPAVNQVQSLAPKPCRFLLILSTCAIVAYIP